MTTIPGDLPLGIQGYERKTPLHEKALYWAAAIGAAAALIFNNFSWSAS